MSISVILSNHRGPASSGEVRIDRVAQLETVRAWRHPLSRWYICPLASRLTAWLVGGPTRPWHLTLAGLACGIVAAGCVASQVVPAPIAAILALAAWFFDRADGILARRLGSSDRPGAWLDASTDELVDLGLQVIVATAAAARASGSDWPWVWLVLFLLGKYLLMHGLSCERDETAAPETAAPRSWLRTLYHLPGNADVRVHLLAAALLSGWLTEQLAIVALYYNLRWLVRYVTGLKLAAEAPT
jgi:phosphatidylglycerophosphate synthase